MIVTREYACECLNRAISDNGIKASDLADYLGVTPQLLSAYRHAKTAMSIELLSRICDYFNLTFDQFFDIQPLDKSALSADEARLVANYRATTPSMRHVLSLLLAEAPRGHEKGESE